MNCYLKKLVLEILERVELSYRTKVHSKHMGIHPKNRNGKKMNYMSMHKKGSKVFNVGFRLSLCGPDKAIAFENHPVTQNCKIHTLDLTRSPYFGTYKPESIRMGSIGCSHLNQWIAAVHDGSQTPFSDAMSDPGQTAISTARVTHNAPELTTAVQQGLDWTCIKYQVEEAYPLLPSILQRALNIEHHVGEGDS